MKPSLTVTEREIPALNSFSLLSEILPFETHVFLMVRICKSEGKREPDKLSSDPSSVMYQLCGYRD